MQVYDRKSHVRSELREELSAMLWKLNRNLQLYPREVLKTRYQKGYENLSKRLNDMAAKYTEEVALRGFLIRDCDMDEIVPRVEERIKESGILKQISVAIYEHQDISEIDQLANKLSELIGEIMEPYYQKNTCLQLTEACLTEPNIPPECGTLLQDVFERMEDGKKGGK